MNVQNNKESIDAEMDAVMAKPISLLLAEDSDDDAILLIRFLNDNGYKPDYTRVYTKADCSAALESRTFDLIIADYTMPQFTAINVIEMVKERGIDVPLIVVSGTIGEDAAVAAMRAGASDYIVKGKLGRLIPAIGRELEKANLCKAHKLAAKHNQLLSIAIEQAAETVVITDTKGTIEYANPAFQNITGYSLQEIIGQSISLLKSGKQDENFYRDMWTTISSGRVWRGRFKNKRKNGSIYEEEVVISPVRDNTGTILNYVAVKRDVTREVELEQQLRQSQKLTAIGQFAHKVAHDFTNVLMMILGNAELAKKDGQCSTAIMSHLNEITSSANKITSFVAELMAFAHPSPPRTTTILLNKIISGIDEILLKATKPAIKLDFNISNAAVKVNVDASQIEQVIVYMVDNAVDAMPDGGTLTIDVSSTSHSEAEAGLLPASLTGNDETNRDYAILSISDTGCGMTDDMIAHIFDPFFTTKKRNHNAGLGLSTAYRIVEKHNGHITVESAPNKGTTFRIFLPIAVSK